MDLACFLAARSAKSSFTVDVLQCCFLLKPATRMGQRSSLIANLRVLERYSTVHSKLQLVLSLAFTPANFEPSCDLSTF